MARHPQYDRSAALEKAVSLFWEKGYHGSSMKQIEQALDMRPGSIYAAFGSKDGLFSEALALYAETGSADLNDHMQQYDGIVDGFQAYLLKAAESCQNDTCPSRACMVVKTLLETRHTHDSLAIQAREALGTLEANLIRLLEQARSNGELAPDVDCERLGRLFQAQMMALRDMAEKGTKGEQLRALAEDMAGILDHYRARH